MEKVFFFFLFIFLDFNDHNHNDYYLGTGKFKRDEIRVIKET